MIIIDAGSTNTKVCKIIEGQIGKVEYLPGISPSYMSSQEISNVLMDRFSEAVSNEVLWYYGTGCATDSGKNKMHSVLLEYFQSNKINIASDLLGAARAAAQTASGQINILGTGSASCLYRAHNIQEIYQNTGYLFGDYGSGYALGHTLLKALFENRLRTELEDALLLKLGKTKSELISFIYASKQAKSEIARMAKVVHHFKQDTQIAELIKNTFDDFVEYQIKLNPKYLESDQYFCGSIAFHFADELTNCLKRHQMKVKKICKSPIEELSTYHLSYNQ